MAQLLAARLWLLPLTDLDQLMSSLVCITFGQPLIQSEQLSNVAHIFPYFRNSVHAIGLDNDKFPSIIERLDSLTSTTQVYRVLVASFDHTIFLYQSIHTYSVLGQ